MSLKVGIVGLPNVGKSTLFNALTNSHVEVANYPFATINPNKATLPVPDYRLDLLEALFKSQNKVQATIEFVDIAGLIAGASKGEGLGNAFLSNIRETDAIVHVVRGFDDKEILHVTNKIDPIADIETINLELILADEEVIKKRVARINAKKQKLTTELKKEITFLTKLANQLQQGHLINQLHFDGEELKLLKNLQLLTAKPFIYVLNVSETSLSKQSNYAQKVRDYLQPQGFPLIQISAALEVQLSDVSEAEKKQFLNAYGIENTGLEQLIGEAYHQLGLQTFFTAGKKESRAWSFKAGMTAPQGGGLIHSDIERGFIKVDVYSFEDIKELGNEKNVKESGRLRLEGKNYRLKDGDICYFRFNV